MKYQEYADLLGKAIQERRNARGWTLEQVAGFMGEKPSKSSLSAIENGKQTLDIFDFFKLETLLGELPKPEITVTFN